MSNEHVVVTTLPLLIIFIIPEDCHYKMEGGPPPGGRGGRGEALKALLAQKQVTAILQS